jgi:hypothetical protein
MYPTGYTYEFDEKVYKDVLSIKINSNTDSNAYLTNQSKKNQT